MRLRYAGPTPVTFVALGLSVEPGGEFEVDDVEAQRLLRRADVEEVQPPARRKAGKTATPADDAGVPAPVTEEVDRGVSDDH